jgi:hypothetical protein
MRIFAENPVAGVPLCPVRHAKYASSIHQEGSPPDFSA